MGTTDYVGFIHNQDEKYTMYKFEKLYNDTWKHVKDSLPENNELVMGHSISGYLNILKHVDGKFYDDKGNNWCVDLWIPLPDLKVTNIK